MIVILIASAILLFGLVTGAFSLEHVSGSLRHHVIDILVVPAGAVIVAFLRLTLGIRVLGLFRPILLALAFRMTGIPLGLAFLLFALGGITLVRPLLRGIHSFGRLSALLSIVALLMLAPVVLGQYLPHSWLDRVAFFPVVALCLTCESFASVLHKRGLQVAASRTVSTVIAAIIIMFLAGLPQVTHTLLRHPELLILQIGCVLLVDRRLKWRLADRWIGRGTQQSSPAPLADTAEAL